MNDTKTTRDKDYSAFQADYLRKEMENHREQAVNAIKNYERNIQRQKGDIKKRLLSLKNDKNYLESEKKVERLSILYDTKLNLIQQERRIAEQKKYIKHIDATLQKLSLLMPKNND